MPELVGRTLRSKMILASLLLLTSCADDTQWTLTFTTARTCRFPMQNIHYSFLKKKKKKDTKPKTETVMKLAFIEWHHW